MSTRAETIAPDTDNDWPATSWRGWFSVAGGPFAWALELLGGWFIAGSSCLGGTPNWGPLPKGGVWAVHAALALCCLAIAGYALLLGRRAWKASNEHVAAIHGNARPDFIAAVGVIVSASFLLAVVYGVLAQLMLPLCEVVR